MTSRERVLKAVNFEEPDRVPIDLGAMGASGISASLYDRVKRRLGIDTPTKIRSTMLVLAEIEPELLDHWHIDVVPLDASAEWAVQDASLGVKKQLFCGADVCFAPGTNIREDAHGDWFLCGADDEPFAKMPKDGFYFDFLKTTMGGRIDPNAWHPKSTVSDHELDVFARHAERLYTETDKAILGWGGSISLVGLSWLLSDNITQGSLDNWLIMLMTEKDTAHEMMARYVDASIACLKLYHEAVGDRAFAWSVGSDDAGTQRGEVINPALFAEMIVPHYRRLCDWVHANTNWRTFLHSCGSIYNFIPQWIEAGIDIINPVQISAANMEPERLKQEFGGKVVFWGGGCDTQRVLPLAAPDQVREHVRHNIEVLSSGGGYVFTQVHNIQQNVPVCNIEAMFEAAYGFGWYR